MRISGTHPDCLRKVAISSSPRNDVGLPATGLPPFEVQDSVCQGQHTLVLRGELDMPYADTLEIMIRRLCIDGIRGLILDLSQLAFMGSAGLRAVLAAHNLCREHGCELLVQPGNGPVRRLFELTGTIDVLPLQGDAPPHE